MFGTLLQIKLRTELIVKAAMGPNQVLVPRCKPEIVGPNQVLVMGPIGPNQVLAPPAPTKNPDNRSTPEKITKPQKPPAPAVQAAKDPLWKLMQSMYETLNATSPDLTASCWLCYDIKPPFYESIGLDATYNILTSENPSQCSWGDHKIGLTLQHISGKGLT